MKDRFSCENDNMEHENPSVSKDRFPCEICTKTYKNKPDLTRHEKYEHVENHSGSKDRFPCAFCNKTYKTSVTLQDIITWNMKILLERNTDFLVKIAAKASRTSATLHIT